MQIEIDFEVFKALTALRQTENDSYNEVVRRLLQLPSTDLSVRGFGEVLGGQPGTSTGFGGTFNGVWYSNVFFADGTKFRATYKGRTYTAEIKDGRWVGQDGIARNSPSDAANAISGTNVNGWRFWYTQGPLGLGWVRMDELRR